jgi:hypothetical protein
MRASNRFAYTASNSGRSLSVRIAPCATSCSTSAANTWAVSTSDSSADSR